MYLGQAVNFSVFGSLPRPLILERKFLLQTSMLPRFSDNCVCFPILITKIFFILCPPAPPPLNITYGYPTNKNEFPIVLRLLVFLFVEGV